jgi:8-oxo-dGTP pyrophosphatase MutT (NUDIX family)
MTPGNESLKTRLNCGKKSMTIWRPSQRIIVKVLGLVWHEGRLLAAEVKADNGALKGVRPVGGAVEFGETREEALEREFHEELGCGITILGPWLAFENLYRHEGAQGHEFVFAANIRLNDASYYQRPEIDLVEDGNFSWTVRWFDPRNLPNGALLYPVGLADRLITPIS